MADEWVPSNKASSEIAWEGPKAVREDLPSVAVMPFVDLSPERLEGHFCEGLAEEVLQGLNKVEGLKVLSRTSSFLYKDADLPAEEICRRLGVQHLLVGSLRKDAGHLSLKVELVSPAAPSLIWSERFERERSDVFSLVADIVGSIASVLRLEASGPRRPPVDLEAYDRYLKGRQYYFRFHRHGMRFASQMFQEAIGLDPGFAAAWAGLALCAAYLYIYVDRSEDHREEALSASGRALELDPALAEAHVSRGVALSAAGRSEEAEAAFEAALRLDPDLYEAYYFFARHCFAAGKTEMAIQYFEWAAAVRPEDFQAVLLVAQAYDSLGVSDEAEAARRRGLALVEGRLRHVPEDARARYLGANALVALGEREKGLAWARMARSLDPEDSMLLYNLGCIHALAGDPEEALDCLVRAVAAGLTEKNWFLHDGDLESLRQHPRFLELLRTLDA
ncbi:MAG: tetratricopeptide repeat protein [Acidobacteria bacterium]|nr:tetratricopeptide repeat protein [Acidobacteriota bacterium]